jgi:acetyltransferase-like isoleucine patch superfamily enzyme
MQKVKIDDSAVVGLGSVVTKDVESGNIVAGVPAKVIRRG